MKIGIIFLLVLALHAASSSELSARARKPPTIPRPSSFSSKVVALLGQMAKANRYTRYDKCHIIPWQFMRDMVVKYSNKQISKGVMKTFIKGIAQIHKDAAFYDALPRATKTTLATLTKMYETDAQNALTSGNMKLLITSLFNMPSNLYPGDPSNNRSIRNNIDAPKELASSGFGRTTDATTVAKRLFAKYSRYGLTKFSKPGSFTMAKTSDKPPGDTTGDYVTI